MSVVTAEDDVVAVGVIDGTVDDGAVDLADVATLHLVV